MAEITSVPTVMETFLAAFFVFKILGIKKNVQVVVRTVPENKVNGDWISDELFECLKYLLSCRFKIRGIISDNHSSNVAAFRILLNKVPGDTKQVIVFPCTDFKTNTFFRLGALRQEYKK